MRYPRNDNQDHVSSEMDITLVPNITNSTQRIKGRHNESYPLITKLITDKDPSGVLSWRSKPAKQHRRRLEEHPEEIRKASDVV